MKKAIIIMGIAIAIPFFLFYRGKYILFYGKEAYL